MKTDLVTVVAITVFLNMGCSLSFHATRNGGISTSAIPDLTGTLPDPTNPLFQPMFTQLGAGHPSIVSATGWDYATAVATDLYGNSYIVGDSTGNFFDTSGGEADLWLAKINAQGNFVWVKQMTTYSGDPMGGHEFAKGIAVDSSGNIYFCGTTTGAFAPALNPIQSADVIVGKLDPNGDWLWRRQLTPALSAQILNSAAAHDRVGGIAVDSSGNVFIAGHTEGGLAGPVAGVSDGYIAKLDTNGTLVWIKQFNASYPGLTSAAGEDYLQAISLDPDGNIFAGGYTYGNLGATNGGSSDIFVVKVDASTGNLIWIRQFVNGYGGAGVITGAGNADLFGGLVADAFGNVFVGGYTNWILTGPGPYSGGTDPVLAKVDGSGNLLWIKQVLTSYSSLILGAAGGNQVGGLSVDANGDLYVAGATTGVFLASPGGGSWDNYAMKVDAASGNLIWGKQLTTAVPGVLSATGNDGAAGIATHPNGLSTIVGNTNGGLFGPSGGGIDALIWRINADGELE